MGHYREYAPGLGVLIMRGDKNPGNNMGKAALGHSFAEQTKMKSFRLSGSLRPFPTRWNVSLV